MGCLSPFEAHPGLCHLGRPRGPTDPTPATGDRCSVNNIIPSAGDWMALDTVDKGFTTKLHPGSFDPSLASFIVTGSQAVPKASFELTM